MSETIKFWLADMYDAEIKEVKGVIANERLWEKGCDAGYNPHSENICELEEYLEILNELKNDIENRK